MLVESSTLSVVALDVASKVHHRRSLGEIIDAGKYVLSLSVVALDSDVASKVGHRRSLGEIIDAGNYVSS